jgi:hypothetical protein
MRTQLLASTLAFAVACSNFIFAQQSPASSPPPAQSSKSAPIGFVLEDGTPVKLRLSRNLSSATDRKGDQVDFDVLEDLSVDNVVIVPRGAVALGTITEAEHKKSMGRAGKLNVNIDSVRMRDGERAALRAVKEANGGGHVGAMTGGMVATAIVFFPAAPLFLFVHGKDINIPKGTEITGYVNGNVQLDRAKFEDKPATQLQISNQVAPELQGSLSISSTPPGADVEVDGNFIGNTPSQINLATGDHTVKVTKSGFKSWERKLKISGGAVNIAAELEQQPK